MSSANRLETVLRYAFVHRLTPEQWVEPTKECIKAGSTTIELCDLLLTSLFSTTRVSDPLIEQYLTFAVTGQADLSSKTITTTQPLIEAKIFISQLLPFLDSTAPKTHITSSRPLQCTFLLRLLSHILSPLDSNQIISDLQKGEDNPSVELLNDIFRLLSDILATGLYRDWHASQIETATSTTMKSFMSTTNTKTPVAAQNSMNISNTHLGFDSQFSFASQTSMDAVGGVGAVDGPDATLDIDNTQTQLVDDDEVMMLDNNSGAGAGIAGEGAGGGGGGGGDVLKKELNATDTAARLKGHGTTNISDANQSSAPLDIENAVLAAQIMIDLIERKDVKRIFELQHNLKRQTQQQKTNDGEEIYDSHQDGSVFEPWLECQVKLDPKDPAIKACKSEVAAQNPSIKRALMLVQKLTDRDIERRMAVHMKYHELEDEGTARAMPSAGLMGLLYHMVQIRPSLDEDYILDHLTKLQTIKGSFDESFFLEIWLTALGGLREASLNTSCQIPPVIEKEDLLNQNCNSVVAANRLLWKSIVLVKLPYLLEKLQRLKRDRGELDDAKLLSSTEPYNSFESALMKLEAFTGLINACSLPACCTEYYAPDSMSSALVDKMFSSTKGTDGAKADEDDFMDMINDMNFATDDLNTPALESLQALSNNDIFTNIVLVCYRHGFVRSEVVDKLLQKRKVHDQSNNMDIDDDTEKLTPIAAVDQNIDLRFKNIKENLTFSALLELIHIGMISPIHLRKIIDFILALLKEKSMMNDFYALSNICDALAKCPCSVDLILQLYTPQELLSPLENICNNWCPNDYETETDDETITQTADGDEKLTGALLLYHKYGKIWNFTVSVVKRFKLYRDLDKVFLDQSGLLYAYFAEGPSIYGVDILDDSMEVFIENWMTGLTAGDSLPEDLLKSSKPQILLRIVPSIIQRSILLYANQQMDNETFIRIISHFQSPVLDFTLSGIFHILCEELLNGQSAIALTCLRQYIMGDGKRTTNLSRDISLHPVLGSLESLLEFKRQEAAFLTTENEGNVKLAQGMSELMQYIHADNKLDKLTEDHSMMHVETVTTGVIPSTLFEKATSMFRYIVKSGRSLYMSDVDADTNALWDDQAPTKMQVVSHCLDMTLFETALEIGGGHWFVSMIVSQVLEAGRSGGAARAAELGSCLITTPLLYSVNRHNSCINLLRCLLQDVLPSSLHHCAEKNMSYFQGQTLGVFTGECLVLMQNGHESVSKLGKWFFSNLNINNYKKDNEGRGEDCRSLSAPAVDLKSHEGTRFAVWDETVTKSAVWRGFIKGLMSNPVIEEVWPNAFI